MDWPTVASRNIYDTLIYLAERDDSDDHNPDTTGTKEDIRDCNGSRGTERKDDNSAPITDWARSNEAPPGWSKTIPLTPDATIKAVHEALERVARKIEPNFYANKITVLRSRHILASTVRNHDRRRELLYDIVHQERLKDDLEYLEMSITRTDVDDNPIPITFDLTLMLLVHHITNTYSPIIQDWLEKHPLSTFAYDGQAVELIYGAAEDSLTQYTPPKRPQHWTQTNTIAKYFQPIQVGPPRKRQGQAQNRTKSKVKSKKINTSPTEKTDNLDREYEHRQKEKGP